MSVVLVYCFVTLFSHILDNRLWSVLHSLPESVESLDKLRGCLGNLCLPCKECQQHYDAFSVRHPPGDLQTRTQAFDWLIDLHNDVNARLGKPKVARADYIHKRNADRVGEEIAMRKFTAKS